MAAEWQTTTLSDVCSEVRYGYTAKAVDTDTGVRFLRGTDISGRDHIDWNTVPFCEISPQEESRYSLEHGDIVIVRMGTIGETAIIKHPPRSVCASYLIRHRINTAVAVPAYVHYVLRSPMFAAFIQSHGGGSVQPNINATVLGEFTFRLPPVPVQQAIANVLSALDDKIELNRRRNRTLEALARAIFQSWFVDFDPVKAKAAGNQPPGLKPELAALFPDSFEDSPLGPIPAGWRVGTVGDLADFNAWTLGKRDPIDEIDYIEISEVMRGEVGDIKRYSRGTEPGRARRRLRHGDTALSTVRPDRGAYFLSIDPPESFIASTGFAVLTAKQGCWAFVHVLTTRPEFGEELGRLADGGAYPAVRPEVIAARPAVVPASDVLEAFEKIAQPMFLRAEKARQEARALGALRDTLLPQLLSGELRVPDAERIVGRCV